MRQNTLLSILKSLAAVFPRQEKGEVLARVWGLALADVTAAAGEAALVRLLREYDSGFHPTPAQFLKFCGDDTEEQAQAAWGSGVAALRRYGGWSSLDFEDTASAEAIRRMGGWRRLCTSKEDELGWLAKEFREQYRITRQSGSLYSGVVGVGETRLIPMPRPASVPALPSPE